MRPASIFPVNGDSLWAIAGDPIEKIDKLAVTATAIDDLIQPVATGTKTLGASHIHIIELADEVAKDNCVIAGMAASNNNAVAIRPLL